MKAIIEHLIVAVIAAWMAVIGYWAIRHLGDEEILRPNPNGWKWLLHASIITWIWLYWVCRDLHWLVLPVMGMVSPIIGSVILFFPFAFVPFLLSWPYAIFVFPTGIACGFLVSVCTLPFRPKEVLHRNAERLQRSDFASK